MARDRFANMGGWSSLETSLYVDLVDGRADVASDNFLQTLYHKAMFDNSIHPSERDVIRSRLMDYLQDEYEIDFDWAFDWEGYREWYG